MRKTDVIVLFVAEATALSAVAGLSGLGLGSLALAFLARLPLDAIPGFDVFLRNGRLVYSLDPRILGTLLLGLIVASALSALAPASKAAGIKPAAAYSTEQS